MNETIVGLAVPFNEVTRRKDGRLLRFLPGAFAWAIAHQPVDLIINHADRPPVIVIAATGHPDRVLHLWETGAGLLFRHTPVGPTGSTPCVMDAIGERVLTHARQGIFVGASIGFNPRRSESFEIDGVEAFSRVHLVNISLVSRSHVPAFGSTWVRVMAPTVHGGWEWAAA